MKKVQAWFASPLAGIEPVQSGVTMAVSSTGFQLATCSESGERERERERGRERERAPVSVECFAQVALLHNAIVPPGYTVTNQLGD